MVERLSLKLKGAFFVTVKNFTMKKHFFTQYIKLLLLLIQKNIIINGIYNFNKGEVDSHESTRRIYC